MLTRKEAEEKRIQFTEQHDCGSSDKKTPEFYQTVINTFLPQDGGSKEKIAFIVVAHFVHTLPYFLEAITALGDVAALISKHSGVVPKVRETISDLYKEIIFQNIDREILKNRDSHVVNAFFTIITANKKYKYIILDHGGYFSYCINTYLSLFDKRLLGIVEHTANGEKDYRERLPDVPLISIAKSSLKNEESIHVARSIVTAVNSVFFGGGIAINQDVAALGQILIMGYGNIGKNVAKQLRRDLGDAYNNTILIFDIKPSVQHQALRDNFKILFTPQDLHNSLPKTDLIITATDTIALKKNEFSLLKSGAGIVCATSSDKQFAADALDDYTRTDLNRPNNNKKPYSTYVHKRDPNKKIFIAADGDSINFSIGSTSHPILHAIFASVLLSANQFVAPKEDQNLDVSIINMSSKETDDQLLKIYSEIYGLPTEATHSKFDAEIFSKLWNLPELSKHYQVRKRYETVIQGNFNKTSNKAIKQVLAGSGGIGKTQTALSFAHKQKDAYLFVRFITAQTRILEHYDTSPRKSKLSKTPLESAYRLFAYTLQGKVQLDDGYERKSLDYVFDDVKQSLMKLLGDNKKALLIFDNADNQEILNRFLKNLKSFHNIDILITTRNSEWPNAIPITVYKKSIAISYICDTLYSEKKLHLLGNKKLDTFKRSENDEFFQWSNYLKQHYQKEFESLKDFSENKLYRYPLAITHALAYCVAEKVNLATYCEQFTTCMQEVMQGYDKTSSFSANFSKAILGDDCNQSIYVTFKLSFTAIEKVPDRTAAKSAIAILGLCGFLGPNAIPRSLLKQLIKCIHPTLPENKLERHTTYTIDLLKSHSILIAQGESFTLHRFIQEVIRFHWQHLEDSTTQPSINTLFELGLKSLNFSLPRLECLDETESRKFYNLIALIPHMETLTAHIKQSTVKTKLLPEDLALLQSNLGVLYALQGQEQQALLQQEKAIAMPALSTAVIDKLMIRKIRALMALNQYLKAKKLLHEYEFETQWLAHQSLQCDLLCYMHNKELALSTISQILKALSQPTGPGKSNLDPEAIQYVSCHLRVKQAELFFDFGEYIKAKGSAEKILTSTQQNPNQYPRLLGQCHLILAKTCIELSFHDEAIKHGDISIKKAVGFYGETHIQVAVALINYAYLLLNGAKWEKQESIANSARELLLNLSEQGVVKAQRLLGWAYDNGVFVEYKEPLARHFAFKHYEQAVKAGDIPARIHLAKLYQMGQGYVKRYSKYERDDRAYHYLSYAAETDFRAEYALGNLIIAGRGTARKYTQLERINKAFHRYKAAAQSGFAEAQFALGKCFLNRKLPQEELQISQVESIEQAKCWLTHASQQQHEKAILLLQMINAVTDSVSSQQLKSLIEQYDHKVSLLHFAVQEGYVEAIPKLLNAGLDINSRDYSKKDYLIHRAASYGQLAALKELLKHKEINVMETDNTGKTILHFATQGGHSDIIEHVATLRNVDINATIRRDGSTPLHTAALCGELEAFKTLLVHGANIKEVSNNGWTIQHFAAKGGNPDIISLANKSEIDIEARTHDGKRAINIAARTGQLSSFNALLVCNAQTTTKVNNGWSLLHFAAQGGNEDIIKCLVNDHGANVNAKASADGSTPLHIAALCGQSGAFETLVNVGHANVKIVNDNKWTVLHDAADGGHLDIIRLALKYQVDVNAKSSDGTRPIHIAARSCQLAAFKTLLMTDEIDVNATDNNGYTLLHFACEGGHPQIIALSVKKGISMNTRAHNGMAPLHCITAKGNASSLEALLKAQTRSSKLDLHITDNDGKNALHHAVLNKNHGIFNLLCKHGIDEHEVTFKEESLLDLAYSNNDERFQSILKKRGFDSHLFSATSPSNNQSNLVNILEQAKIDRDGELDYSNIDPEFLFTQIKSLLSSKSALPQSPESVPRTNPRKSSNTKPISHFFKKNKHSEEILTHPLYKGKGFKIFGFLKPTKPTNIIQADNKQNEEENLKKTADM